MDQFLAQVLFGAAIGAWFCGACILGGFHVQPRSTWDEFQESMKALRKLGDKLTAENAKLRVVLAAGEITEEGKRVAAMTMAALDSILPTEEVVE